MEYEVAEPVLFNNTLRENIAYSDPSADLDKVIEVAKIADIHDNEHTWFNDDPFWNDINTTITVVSR